jgi:hypothetical protein
MENEIGMIAPPIPCIARPAMTRAIDVPVADTTPPTKNGMAHAISVRRLPNWSATRPSRGAATHETRRKAVSSHAAHSVLVWNCMLTAGIAGIATKFWKVTAIDPRNSADWICLGVDVTSARARQVTSPA